jgi:hypothetical protein
VFLDIVMCRTDGAQPCKESRWRGLRLPVIAATRNRSCRQYFTAGFDHVLEKPFPQAVLQPVLREHVLAPQSAAAAGAAARPACDKLAVAGSGGGSGHSASEQTVGLDVIEAATAPALPAMPADLAPAPPGPAASHLDPPPFRLPLSDDATVTTRTLLASRRARTNEAGLLGTTAQAVSDVNSPAEPEVTDRNGSCFGGVNMMIG